LKYGYSLLLGEHIESQVVDYSDCKSFQIVCPSCKEPIFKVQRAKGEDNATHYLSHYEKSSAYVAECELRVNSLKSDDLQKSNGISRNQRLGYFLSVLRESILKNEYGGNMANLTKAFDNMQKSKTLSFLRDGFYENAKMSDDLKNGGHVHELFDDYIKEYTEISGGFPKTAFSIQTQKRIAFDVWLHLLSGNARSNFDFVFNNSFLFLVSRIEKSMAVKTPVEYEKLLHKNMVDLIMNADEDGMETVSSMMKYKVPPPYSIGLDLLSKMLAEINHEIYGCLLRVPYFELLKNQNQNPPQKEKP
jgi:hypothetical protein